MCHMCPCEGWWLTVQALPLIVASPIDYCGLHCTGLFITGSPVPPWNLQMHELKQLFFFPFAQLRQADIFKRPLILREQKGNNYRKYKRHNSCHVSDTSFYSSGFLWNLQHMWPPPGALLSYPQVDTTAFLPPGIGLRPASHLLVKVKISCTKTLSPWNFSILFFSRWAGHMVHSEMTEKMNELKLCQLGTTSYHIHTYTQWIHVHICVDIQIIHREHKSFFQMSISRSPQTVKVNLKSIIIRS
jgi:hypothetical protein